MRPEGGQDGRAPRGAPTDSDETDVLIIGAGLIGCATAYYLSREGVECLVVDRGEINREGSGANAGSLHIQIRRPERAYADETLRQFIPMKVAAGRLWAQIEQELGCSVGLKVKGGILVAETDEGLAFIREKVAYEREIGLETELVSAAEMREIAPHLSEHLVGGSFDPAEGLANPLLVTPAYVRLAISLGARFRIHTAVTATEALRVGGFLVTTSTGTIRAKRILNAAGPWAGTLAAMVGAPLPVEGHVIQASVTERHEPILDQLVQHVRPALSLKQTTLGTFMIGGGWPATIDSQTGRPAIDPACVAGNLGVALRMLPALHDVQVVRTWLGVMAHSEDRDGQRLQVFGEIPSVPGYFVVAGGTLFTMGPLFSRLAAELMTTGRTSYPIDIFHPERFGRARSVPRL